MENGGVFVFVDGDDALRVLHSCEVLDRSRDSHGNIEFGGNDLSRLAHLIVIGGIARINRRARGPDCSPQLVRDSFQQDKVFFALQGATAGNDHPRCGQFGAFRVGKVVTDKLRQTRVIGCGVDFFNGGRPTCVRDGLEGCGADGQKLNRVGGAHCRKGIARIDGAGKGISGHNGADIGNLLHVEQGGGPGERVFSIRRCRRQNVAIAGGKANQQGGDVFRELMGIGGGLCVENLPQPRDLCGLCGDGGAILPRNQEVNLIVDSPCGGNGFEGGVFKGAVVVFSKDKNSHELNDSCVVFEMVE